MAKKRIDKFILVDADVVSHFISAGEILSINAIFPYEVLVLDKVYAELERFTRKKQQVDNLINLGIVRVIPFPEDNEEIKKEYAHIKKLMFKGDGESACLAMVRYSQHILASSNLRDIKSYCEMHRLSYLTTMDFLCYALNSGLWDRARCDCFITAVLSAGSKLPVGRMNDYACRVLDFI